MYDRCFFFFGSYVVEIRFDDFKNNFFGLYINKK